MRMIISCHRPLYFLGTLGGVLAIPPIAADKIVYHNLLARKIKIKKGFT